PPPYPLAMVIADAIHTDPGTGKRFILGTFSVLHATAFPAVQASMAVYISLTDGRGKVPFRFALVRTDADEETLFETNGELEFNDPRAVMDMVFAFQNVQFPHPGEYRFELHAAGEFMIERRILLNQLPEAPQ